MFRPFPYKKPKRNLWNFPLGFPIARDLGQHNRKRSGAEPKEVAVIISDYPFLANCF